MRKLLYILPLISLVACETYDADYTANEISYKTEAKSFFANADPSHDWMIDDDQIFVCSKSINEATRALTASGTPTVTLSDGRYSFSKSEAESALNYMAETKDNRGKCVQNFEYLAVGTTTYEITPVFWGTKFVKTNYVGVYYIDESGNKVDLDPFWSDADGTMHYVTNLGEASIQAMTDQLTKVSTVDVTHSVGICGSTNFTTTTWGSTNYTCKTCGHKYSKSEYRALPNGKCNQPKTQTDKAQITGYSSPVFTITVPNGVKWGLYLQTKTTQSNGKDIRWYSNADYNVNLCNSAATFTYANVTYVSFEDAPNPYNCSGNKLMSSGHQCTDHPGENDSYNGTFGHYDHDMNDIILTITPRPIESTYKYATVRVMCEDLGGTYDWDFNDVVYDITYEETSKTSSQVRLTLKALGGTLPVRMYYKGQAVGSELHSLAPDAIDVLKDSCAVKEYSVDITTLSAEGYDLTNFKNIAKDITLRVAQKDNTTQEVVFPQYQGDNTPQCFMTSVSTPWSYERVSIKDTYPLFESWVTNQNLTNWWESNPNF